MVGILSELEPEQHGITAVHLWAPRSLLDAVSGRPWLVKHHSPAFERGLVSQLCWQARSFAREAAARGCDIAFSTDASTVSSFEPMVVLSQDMLSYEPGVIGHFGYGRERARLIAIRWAQNRALRRARGAVFLTRYAADVIQRCCGPLRRITYVPHGVAAAFRDIRRAREWPAGNEAVRCLYVSNAAPYKHQWHVVDAVARLRARGLNVHLELVGGGSGKAQARLERQIALSDPRKQFVRQREFVPQEALPALLEQADLFIFASSCESMPVTLLEAMAAGLPIACSNRGPMPEVLEDGGVYFDPENPDSIAAAIEELVLDGSKRGAVASRAREISQRYSWARCARETFSFIVDTCRAS